MIAFFAAITVSLLLMLILHFMPMNMSFKSKIMIILASFFAAAIGLFSSVIFHLWQTALIMIILIGLLFYLLNKRLVEDSKVNSKKDLEITMTDAGTRSNPANTSIEKEKITRETEPIVPVIPIPSRIEDVEDELEVVEPPPLLDETDHTLPDLEENDDISFLSKRKELVEQRETEEAAVPLVNTMYLSDIEKQLELEEQFMETASGLENIEFDEIEELIEIELPVKTEVEMKVVPNENHQVLEDYEIEELLFLKNNKTSGKSGEPY